jgi:FKBP-type peptidyl-prolyl cis-trans isomerase 2
VVVATTLAAVAFVACGGGSTDPTATPAPDILASAPTVPTPTPSAGERIAGVWEGSVTIQGNPLSITIVFYDNPEGVTATITVPSQRVADYPLTNVRLSRAFESTRVEFDFPEIESVWVGGLRGDTITGDFYQPNIDQATIHGVFELKRVGDAPARVVAAPTVTTEKEEARAVIEGDAVSVHYKGTLDGGEVFDSSEGREPLSFTVGSREVIAGFDDAVLGMVVGDTVTVRIDANDAYGEHRDDLIIDIPLSSMPTGLKPGDKINDGQGLNAVVVEVTDDVVRVDANHELAGMALTFEIELVFIR